MPEQTPAERLGVYVATLRRWWPLALAMVVLAAVVGLVIAKQQTASYEATARVLLDREREVDSLLDKSDYATDPERDLNTAVELITLEPVAERVRRSLGLSDSPAALVGRVATAVDRNSSVVSITASDDSAADAARLANAFAVGYRDYRGGAARAAVEDAAAAAEARLRTLPPGQERTELRAELRRLEVAGAFRTGGVQVVHRATAAAAQRHPRPAVSALVGGFLGAILAALVLLVLARTDRRVDGTDDLERITRRPVVASIPNRGARDALATLAVSLWRPKASGPTPALVLLSSPGPDEGTAEVTLGLARALGALGRSAIAIEADLRTPSFADRLGLEAPAGLTGVLADETDLERALVSVGDGAAVLPAGELGPLRTAESRPLPQLQLAGPRMAAVVEDACGRADVVLLAGAPVGVVGDALALAGLVDTVLLVARVGTTRVDDLEQAIESLARAGAPPLSVVATPRAPRAGLGALRRTLARRRTAAAAAPQGGAPATTTSEVTVG